MQSPIVDKVNIKQLSAETQKYQISSLKLKFKIQSYYLFLPEMVHSTMNENYCKHLLNY